MLKAIIFDFDGLILDTESTEYLTWQEVYAEHGVQVSLQQWAARIGIPRTKFDPYLHLEQLCGRSLDKEAIRFRRRRRTFELNADKQARDGVDACIRAAKQRQIKLAVASSSDSGWVASHLKRLGLYEYFDTLVCEEDTRAHKPRPEPYLRAMELLGVTASQAIALEDSPNGVTAAKAAGLFCIAVPNPITKHLDLRHADLIVESLAQYPLERIQTHFAGC